MKKKTAALLLCAVIAASFSAGAAAVGNLEAITAYRNRSLSIRYNGEEQQMYNAAGERVYPISYQGTTYVPIRAAADILNTPVTWDEETYSVLLGRPDDSLDFIDAFQPYSSKYSGENTLPVPSSAGRTETIGGKEYDHWLKLPSNQILYYALDGNYTTLTFDAYTEEGFVLYFYNDNQVVCREIVIEAGTPIATYTVNVSGISELRITGGNPEASSANGYLFLFNASIL